MSKSSRRAEAARKQVAPAAEDFVHSAADRVGPLVHTAADRVGPLAQSAATRVRPLAEAAADRIGVAADKVSPLAHTAADRLGPLAQSAAERVGPITHGAADRLAPLANSAADRVAPFATGAVDRVSPYAQQAAGRVSPYAHQAAERIAPIATSAKQRGARVAQGAVEKIGPVLDDAFERLSPAVEAARDKMSSEILPMLSEKLSAAAGAPLVVEAKKRGKATVAAAKGELELPEEKKKGRWLMWLALAAGVAGVAVIVVRKFLGSQDADWQAARPTTPYGPTKPTDLPTQSAQLAPQQRLLLSMRWTTPVKIRRVDSRRICSISRRTERRCRISRLRAERTMLRLKRPLSLTKPSPMQMQESRTKLPPRQRASARRCQPNPPSSRLRRHPKLERRNMRARGSTWGASRLRASPSRATSDR